jgi:hypothetical protein
MRKTFVIDCHAIDGGQTRKHTPLSLLLALLFCTNHPLTFAWSAIVVRQNGASQNEKRLMIIKSGRGVGGGGGMAGRQA